MTEVVIVAGARTPIGNLGGVFKNVSAPELGSIAIKGALKRSHFSAADIDEVIFGCVLAAGQGQAPARQASLGAEISSRVPCTTINKMCGSGMKAIMLAHDEIIAGSFRTIIAGGMESMSNAPYLIPKARSGYRMGHAVIL